MATISCEESTSRKLFDQRFLKAEKRPELSKERSNVALGLHRSTMKCLLSRSFFIIHNSIVEIISEGHFLQLMFHISFTVPPTIRPDPPDGNYVVKKGRKVELKCVASGNPDPTIIWTRQVWKSIISQYQIICQRYSNITWKNGVLFIRVCPSTIFMNNYHGFQGTKRVNCGYWKVFLETRVGQD